MGDSVHGGTSCVQVFLNNCPQGKVFGDEETWTWQSPNLVGRSAKFAFLWWVSGGEKSTDGPVGRFAALRLCCSIRHPALAASSSSQRLGP
jgi:hypothetical protein